MGWRGVQRKGRKDRVMPDMQRLASFRSQCMVHLGLILWHTYENTCIATIRNSLSHTHMHTHMHFGSCSSYLPFISSIFLCSMGSVVEGLLEVGLLQRQEVRDRLRGPELAFSLYSTTLHLSVALMGLYRWMFYINMKKCKSSTRKKAKHTDLFSLTSEDH